MATFEKSSILPSPPQGVSVGTAASESPDQLRRILSMWDLVLMITGTMIGSGIFLVARLGAIVCRYISKCHGRTSSPLHAGLPTDRLVAEWWVRSPRLPDLLSGKTHAPGPNGARISIRVAIHEMCGSDPRGAEKIQSRVREQFERHIAGGCASVGFEFDEQQGSYVMEPYEN